MQFTYFWPVQKPDGSCRMTVDYAKLNQVVTATAAGTPDAISLLEQVNTSPFTSCVFADLESAFFLDSW